MKLYDQNGDECQMTGLPHMFYDKVAVDERIAELEKVEESMRQVIDYCAYVQAHSPIAREVLKIVNDCGL